MRINNGQIEFVLGAITSVMSGAVLPVDDAGDWATAIVDLSVARRKVLFMEKPVFAGAPLDADGNPEITVKDHPDAVAQISEIRDAECGVDIPTIPLEAIKTATGKASPVKLALLIEVGIITREIADDIGEVAPELKAG